MVAYVVGEVFVTNDAFAEEYRPKVKALVEKHGGKIVAASGPENLEGERSLPDWLVIIQFPDMDTARGWYSDPTYAPLIELRDTGSRSEIALVDGMA